MTKGGGKRTGSKTSRRDPSRKGKPDSPQHVLPAPPGGDHFCCNSLEVPRGDTFRNSSWKVAKAWAMCLSERGQDHSRNLNSYVCRSSVEVLVMNWYLISELRLKLEDQHAPRVLLIAATGGSCHCYCAAIDHSASTSLSSTKRMAISHLVCDLV